MPDFVRSSLEDYNNETIEIFTDFVKNFVSSELSKEPENKLPTSQLEFSTSWPAECKQGTLMDILHNETVPHKARSSFSGKTTTNIRK